MWCACVRSAGASHRVPGSRSSALLIVLPHCALRRQAVPPCWDSYRLASRTLARTPAVSEGCSDAASGRLRRLSNRNCTTLSPTCSPMCPGIGLGPGCQCPYVGQRVRWPRCVCVSASHLSLSVHTGASPTGYEWSARVSHGQPGSAGSTRHAGLHNQTLRVYESMDTLASAP